MDVALKTRAVRIASWQVRFLPSGVKGDSDEMPVL